MARRTCLFFSVSCVSLVLAAGLAYALRPYTEERVIAYHDGWQVSVAYPPRERRIRITVRMDGMSAWRTVDYRITSLEAWAPHWEARFVGRLSEFVILDSGWMETKEPMSSEVAKRVARSYRIALILDKSEREIDFSTASFAEPVPMMMRLRDSWRYRTRLVK